MTEDVNAIIILISFGVLGLLYGLYNYFKVNYFSKNYKDNECLRQENFKGNR